jgi:uncharacterized coiled-coil DUF342 family protein
MKEKYIPGEGCQCLAHNEYECGCDADWTPREVYELREQRDRLAEELRTLIEERNEVCNQRDAAFERYNEAVELCNAAVIGAKLIDKDLKKAKRDLKKAESERDKLEKGLKDLINYANSFKPFFNRYQKRQTADTKGDDHE